MPLEIERKFLVKIEQVPLQGVPGASLVQGYLSRQPTVRVRVADEKGFLTIKGPATGIVRDEYEYEIPVGDALELIEKLASGVVRKTRYLVPSGRHTFEVDVYHGPLEGLFTAEVEMSSAEEEVDLPAWLDREVSHDRRYANSALALSGIPAQA